MSTTVNTYGCNFPGADGELEFSLLLTELKGRYDKDN